MASTERVVALPVGAEVKPRLRGVSHALAFFAALGGCAHLALAPARGLPYGAGLVFGVSLVLMFGISGTYHCPPWSAAVHMAPRTYRPTTPVPSSTARGVKVPAMSR